MLREQAVDRVIASFKKMPTEMLQFVYGTNLSTVVANREHLTDALEIAFLASHRGVPLGNFTYLRPTEAVEAISTIALAEIKYRNGGSGADTLEQSGFTRDPKACQELVSLAWKRVLGLTESGALMVRIALFEAWDGLFENISQGFTQGVQRSDPQQLIERARLELDALSPKGRAMISYLAERLSKAAPTLKDLAGPPSSPPPRKQQPTPPSDALWYLAINMAFLCDDDLSDAMGEPVSKQVLSLLGATFARVGGPGIYAAHPHEDQFAGMHHDRTLLEDIAGGMAEAASKLALYQTRDDGSGALQEGFDFKFAVGTSYEEADKASMQAGKRGRLSLLPSGQFTGALKRSREAGYLLLDADSLLLEAQPARPFSALPRLDRGRGSVWSDGSDDVLAKAESSNYFCIARELLVDASKAAIQRRRATRSGQQFSA